MSFSSLTFISILKLLLFLKTAVNGLIYYMDDGLLTKFLDVVVDTIILSRMVYA